MSDWVMWTAIGTLISSAILAVTIATTFFIFHHENKRIVRIVINWIERDYIQIRFENNGNRNFRLDAFGIYLDGRSIRLDSNEYVFEKSDEYICLDAPTTITIRQTFFEKWLEEKLEYVNSQNMGLFRKKHDKVRFYVTGSGLNFYSTKWIKIEELVGTNGSELKDSQYIHTVRWKTGPFERSTTIPYFMLILIPFMIPILSRSTSVFIVLILLYVHLITTIFVYYRAKAGTLGIGKILIHVAFTLLLLAFLHFALMPSAFSVLLMTISVIESIFFIYSVNAAGYYWFQKEIYHDIDVNRPY